MPSISKPGKKSRTATALRVSRKIIVDFPEPLYSRTEKATRELATSRSALIRLAVERFLEVLSNQRLERELLEGYQANAKLNQRIAQDFSHVDAENI
jgi:metal-responsive CopG/Arc/MetJ family transcriptional regulator